jgi:hypothetical protein
MKSVPDVLGGSRSIWKRKLAAPLVRIVEADVVAPGAFVASGSPRAANVATLPLVPPVSTQVALPTPEGTFRKAPRAPFASAGAVQLPVQQTLRVSVSPGEKPSASSAANAPVAEGTIGRSTKPRVTFMSPSPASARNSTLTPAIEPTVAVDAVNTCGASGAAPGFALTKNEPLASEGTVNTTVPSTAMLIVVLAW